jgi:hypothetical protein
VCELVGLDHPRNGAEHTGTARGPHSGKGFITAAETTMRAPVLGRTHTPVENLLVLYYNDDGSCAPRCRRNYPSLPYWPNSSSNNVPSSLRRRDSNTIPFSPTIQQQKINGPAAHGRWWSRRLGMILYLRAGPWTNIIDFNSTAGETGQTFALQQNRHHSSGMTSVLGSPHSMSHPRIISQQGRREKEAKRT